MALWMRFRNRNRETWAAWLIGLTLVGQVLLGLWLVIKAVDAIADPPEFREALSLFPPLRGLSPDADTILVILVVGAGLIGGFIHAATSFVSYLGNQTFRASWTLWYLFRGLIGVSLAMFVYLVFRGGLLAGGADGETVNVFGVAALSGLAGMFSKQAIDKLREVFDTAFQRRNDDEREDKLQPQVDLESVEPQVLFVGGSDPAVTLRATGGTSDVLVSVNGERRTPDSVHGDTVVIALTQEDVAEPGVIAFQLHPQSGDPSRSIEVPVVEK